MGLIPAHAGKTIGASVTANGSEAHPRSRGENIVKMITVDQAVGSSPLTRGKLRTPIRRQCEDRLIPAHAGKTQTHALHRPIQPAHPRSRGENTS